MIRVVCPGCNAKYRFDESRLAGKPSVRAKCQKCGGPIEISASAVEPSPGPAAAATADAKSSGRTTAPVHRMRSDLDDRTINPAEVPAETLELPSDLKYSVAVLQGRASGEIFPITKARMILGRADCDIVLDDPECSREHAAIEVLGSRVVLRDLGSTNGTFLGGKRIEQGELENHTEFRVGEHVLMLIITSQE
jgi:predicted Zn finger-like uncharacterized protein